MSATDFSEKFPGILEASKECVRVLEKYYPGISKLSYSEDSLASCDGVNTDVIVRKPELRKITGLSDTTIWRLEKTKKFPQRRRLSASAYGWLLSEVLAWVRSRPNTEGK